MEMSKADATVDDFSFLFSIFSLQDSRGKSNNTKNRSNNYKTLTKKFAKQSRLQLAKSYTDEGS